MEFEIIFLLGTLTKRQNNLNNYEVNFMNEKNILTSI